MTVRRAVTQDKNRGHSRVVNGPHSKTTLVSEGVGTHTRHKSLKWTNLELTKCGRVLRTESTLDPLDISGGRTTCFAVVRVRVGRPEWGGHGVRQSVRQGGRFTRPSGPTPTEPYKPQSFGRCCVGRWMTVHDVRPGTRGPGS